MDDESIPIACRLTTPELGRRQAELATGIMAAVEACQERPDGYAFRFAPDEGRVVALAEFIESERVCCPFIQFEIVREPADGPIWLGLGGGPGVKEFVQQSFVALVPRIAFPTTGS